jgi:hypothetical protein
MWDAIPALVLPPRQLAYAIPKRKPAAEAAGKTYGKTAALAVKPEKSPEAPP